MELKDLEKGSLTLIEGRDHRAISSMAVEVVSVEEKKALIMDGSQTINPYFMVRECKSKGLDEKKVLKNIMISRAFTAYQYEDLIRKAEERLDDEEIIFLGAVALTPIFEDEEMSEEEGRWLRSRSIKKVKSLVKEKELYGAIVDPEIEMLESIDKKDERTFFEQKSRMKKYMNTLDASSFG